MSTPHAPTPFTPFGHPAGRQATVEGGSEDAPPRRARWALVGLWAALVAAPGCGECVFREPVHGAVRSQAGAPISGVKVSTCAGDQCRADAADQPCNEATTDARGEFSLVVSQCRPAAFACDLRPVRVERAGCAGVVVQPKRGGEELAITMTCEGPAP